MSPRTEEAYVGWIRRYIFFHGKRHPDQLTEREITMFLNHLATARKVSASTQNQALAALLFLYERVLGRQLNWLDGVVHAKRPERLPTVLSRSEVAAILAALKGVEHICGSLLYGAGLRLMELLRLRAKDVDFSNQQIIVRDGKGGRDRVALLPTSLTARLREHLELARERHERDLALGAGQVELPDALRVKYPTAPREWHWQWVFAATRTYSDAVTGEVRRHHLHETVVQRAIRRAGIAARIPKPVSPHTLRHYAESLIMPS